jgi:uncharacterized protein YybS (DUF2232 family)
MSSVESRIFLWGGVAVGGSGLLWIVPGFNAVFSVGAIAALVLIVSRLGYLRAFWAALGGLIMVMASTTLVMGESVGALNAAVFAVAVVAPGIMMGMASRGLSSAVKTLWYGSIPILLLFVVLLTFYSTLVGSIPSMTRQVNTIMGTSLDQSPAALKMMIDKYGPDGAKEKFLADLDEYIVFFIKIIPGTIVIGFLTIIVISLSLAGNIGSRMSLMIPRLKPFYLWYASDWWLIPTAVGLALTIFVTNDFWHYLGINILVVTGNVYAIAGLAVVAAFMRRLAFPMLLRIAFYLILFFMSFLGLLSMAILGLADSRFRFRRETPEEKDDSQEN